MVVPVSVTSMMQSLFSGGLASVAPKDRKIFARALSPFLHQGVTSMGSASPKRFLYCGVFLRYSVAMFRYSVLMRKFLPWAQIDSMNSPKVVPSGTLLGTAMTKSDFSVFKVLQDFDVSFVFPYPVFACDA